MGLGGTELLTLSWGDRELAGWPKNQILGPAEPVLLGILIRQEGRIRSRAEQGQPPGRPPLPAGEAQGSQRKMESLCMKLVAGPPILDLEGSLGSGVGRLMKC